jgi:hypothetical protein
MKTISRLGRRLYRCLRMAYRLLWIAYDVARVVVGEYRTP